MSILLQNGTWVDPDTLNFVPCDIRVYPGNEGNVEFSPTLDPLSGETVIECRGKYITASFICGHHHAYSALALGMGAPRKIPENFTEILQYIWWNLDTCLDPEMIEVSGLLTAAQCLKNGTTFIIDHHASPSSIWGSLNILAGAFEKLGASHLLCYEITDRGGEQKARQGLEETASYLSNHQGLVGLHASFTVGDTTLNQAVQLASQFNSGIHIHVAEAPDDQVHAEKTYHTTVVERLHKAGVLDFSKSILAHGLHLTATERTLIAQSPCWMVQNTESNQNNRVGTFSHQGLGKNVLIGTDGMHSNMIRSAQSAYFGQHPTDNLSYADIYQQFRNAALYLKENKIKGYGSNHLVVLDYNHPTAFDQSNFYGHFIFGWDASMVEHVIASGNLVVHHRKLTRIDENQLLEKSRNLSRKLWKKMQE